MRQKKVKVRKSKPFKTKKGKIITRSAHLRKLRKRLHSPWVQKSLKDDYTRKKSKEKSDHQKIDDDELEALVQRELDKQRAPIITKLGEIAERLEVLDSEHGRNYSRQYRFGLILQYPRGGEQENLASQYKELLRKLADIESRENQLKINDQLLAELQEAQKKDEIEEPQSLPTLKKDEKYYIVAVDEYGNIKKLSFTTKEAKAQKDLEDFKTHLADLNKISYRKYENVELIPAKNLDHVRDIIYSRGKSDYIITGNTYENRKKIHQIAKVKFDYDKKGYRGKISPEQLEQLKKIEGLIIEKDVEITEEDEKLSKIARLESKSRKHLRHKRKEGSIWQSENPFSEAQNQIYNSLTWIFTSGNNENVLNTRFQESVNQTEDMILNKLGIKKIENAPDDIQNAFDKYRKEVYEYYLAKLRGVQAAPSWAVTGRSNYKGNPEKRERIEKKAYEELKKAQSQLEKIITINRAIERTETQYEAKNVIDFGSRNTIINKKLRQFRTKYPNLDITQYSSGSKGGKQWKWYIIKNKNSNKQFSMEIREDGTVSTGKGHFPIQSHKSYLDETAFYNEFNDFLNKVSRDKTINA